MSIEPSDGEIEIATRALRPVYQSLMMEQEKEV
jgi:hypothetical protein